MTARSERFGSVGVDRLADGVAAQKKRVLVAGASGLVGRGLCDALQQSGHGVVRLVRARRAGSDEIEWDPTMGLLEASAVASFDAVVCLSGAGIADARWSAARKRVLRASRIDTVRTLARAVLSSGAPPSVWLQASAMGAYDDSGARELAESAPRGTGFLADLCAEWEGETEPLQSAGVRTVLLRTGVVLTPRGGALARMLLPFRLGLGGPIGSGRQCLSWIAYDDVLGAAAHLLDDARAAGPVNLVAPRPVEQREFARALGRVLARPSFVPLPAPVVGLLFGEMGRTLLLGGARVVPRELERLGYRFRWPELEPALRHLLGR